jgi:hypothetical protein
MYDFSFWLANVVGAPNGFTVFFGPDLVLNVGSPPAFSYTFEDFTVTAAAATTMISFMSAGPVPTEWLLDDVSVNAVPAPPLSPWGQLWGSFLLARRAYGRVLRGLAPRGASG